MDNAKLKLFRGFFEAAVEEKKYFLLAAIFIPGN